MSALHEGIELHYVETVEEAERFLTWLGERRPILAIDTETTGLEWWTPNFCRLIQFGDGMQGWTLSVERWLGLCDIAMSKVVENRTPVAMHNAGFDMHALEVTGLPFPAWSDVHDTWVMDHLSYPIQAHGLKPIARKKWGPWAVVGQDMLKDHFKEAKVDWATVSLDEPLYTTYAAMDTVLTARLADDLGGSLVQRGLWPAYEREMAALAILWRSERRGMEVYTEYAVGLREQWLARLVELQLQLDAWGVDNPGSKAQVVAALKRKEGWDPEEFTETGEPKLDKATLNGLENSAIAPLVLEYKRKVKWIGAYLDHFIENQDAEGRVHPSINTLAARTGRMSIQRPALQTLPSKEASIRHCIRPDEGHHFWAIDYDAQELRVMAHYAQDPGLIELFREGYDPHSYVASVVYQLPYEEMMEGQHKVQRGTAKNCVTPDTLVLTSKLRWVRAGELRVGDRLMAFDAEPPEGTTSRERSRRWREARINTTGYADRPTVRVTFSDGSVLTGTEDHPIVTRHSGWKVLGDLKPGNVVVKALNVRTVDPTRRAGWLAGMFDGEGWVTQATGEIGVSQNMGPTADLLQDRLGPAWRGETDDNNHRRFRFRGTQSARTEWMISIGVGETKAADYVRAMEGSIVQGHDVTVVSVETAGVQRIVTLGTDQLTYVSEGFLSHNTQYSRIYGAGAQKIADTAGVPVAQIEEFMRIYDVRFPGVQRFMDGIEATARHRMMHEGEPYITTAYGRWINVEPDKTYALVNYQIQGECADLLKDKIVLLDKMGYGDNIVLPVHDEILFSFPEGEVDGPMECKRLMEELDRFVVPLTCEITGPGATWGAFYE